jgi:hypothetical protein
MQTFMQTLLFLCTPAFCIQTNATTASSTSKPAIVIAISSAHASLPLRQRQPKRQCQLIDCISGHSAARRQKQSNHVPVPALCVLRFSVH